MHTNILQLAQTFFHGRFIVVMNMNTVAPAWFRAVCELFELVVLAAG